MDKTITTALLIVISIITALGLFNAAYPAILKGGDAIANMANRETDRMRNQIAIIHIAAELDSQGTCQDVNANGLCDVFIWVKNVGSSTISPVDSLDLFFGPEANYVRIPQGTSPDNGPYWTGQLENGAADWTPTATLKITVHCGLGQLHSGPHFAKVTIPNGVSDEQVIGL